MYESSRDLHLAANTARARGANQGKYFPSNFLILVWSSGAAESWHWWTALRFAATFMGNTTISSVFSSTEDSHPKPIISSSAIMSIEANSHWKPSACYLHTKSSIQRTSSFFVGIMSALQSIASTAFTTSAKDDIISNSGRHLLTASIACQLQPLLMRKSLLCTED